MRLVVTSEGRKNSVSIPLTPPTSRSADVCKIRRQIQQQLQARRYAQAPSGVCAIDRSTAVPSADIHSVLTLKTAHGHDEAGVRDIRPVRCDFVLDGRTTLRLCVDRAQNRNRRQQTYLESSSAHENLDRRTTAWRRWRKATEPVAGIRLARPNMGRYQPST